MSRCRFLVIKRPGSSVHVNFRFVLRWIFKFNIVDLQLEHIFDSAVIGCNFEHVIFERVFVIARIYINIDRRA